ncbi:MAG: cell wall hydrolase [Sphingomonadales bacterium]|nr:cell wall hydrolase [Sphingomonadales bacterium]MBU3993964.1 cell wall hydrolase [Alphaproteobacteria bacterium]
MPVFPPHDLPAAAYDLRPRDFHARLSRRTRGVGAARAARHRGRHALALIAAVAVPAVAAPREWAGAWSGFDSGQAEAAMLTVPFEPAGGGVNGSAPYYLMPASAPAPLDTEAHWGGQAVAGPAAQVLRARGSEADRMRALTCLTQAIYYEAASEPDAGQRAVAQVVLNRVAHPAYPQTVCGVVYQGSERPTGCQFTFTCDGALARTPVPLFWRRAEAVARAALAGHVYAPVGLATHYHTTAIHPYWADSLAYLGTIGAHRFYRFGGPAGAPATFNVARYRGGEPAAAPLPRPALATVPAQAAGAPQTSDAGTDPVAIERAFARGFKVASVAADTGGSPAGAPARALPAPAYAASVAARGGDALYTAKALPGANAIRPEYANSGQWISRTGT